MPGQKLIVHHRNALLERVLAQPQLLTRVQQLAPSSLARAINHIGLEDAAELVAMASADQLSAIFDEELWVSSEPGVDETFDSERFALWLTVLLESGDGFAARKLLELDEDFLTMALSHHLFVIDVEALAVSMARDERSDDEDLIDKRLEGTLYLELEEYRVIATNERSWEAISAVLRELNEQHFADLSRILGRCCQLSESYIEEHGGLLEVLTQAESLAEEVAGARSDRREQQGYVAPSSARAFLGLCLQLSDREVLASDRLDAVTAAHFRALPTRGVSQPAPLALPNEHDDALVLLLAEAEREEPAIQPSKRLKTGTVAQRHAVQEAMTAFRTDQPTLYDKLALELAYLANVLLAGHMLDGRRMRPAEAFEAALQVCELGAEHAARLTKSEKRQRDVSGTVSELGLVKLFQLGFRHWGKPQSTKARTASASRP